MDSRVDSEVQVNLQPIATPSILGLYGFAGATLIVAAGWVFIISAVCAWYTASALMFESVSGKAVLPVGKTRQAQEAPEVNRGVGEPGVKKGQ